MHKRILTKNWQSNSNQHVQRKKQSAQRRKNRRKTYNMEITKWLENWFSSHCDGDWEHENPLIIQSTSNPGWSIIINLNDTSLQDLNIEYSLIETSETEWHGYSLKNGRFNAAGDPTKLLFLLELFKKIVEENS